MGTKKTSKKEIKKQSVPVNIGSDHIRVPVNAPTTIVEYGDYECPYTGMAYSVFKEVMLQFSEKKFLLKFIKKFII